MLAALWDHSFLSPFWADVILVFLVTMVIANRVAFWIIRRKVCEMFDGLVRETSDYKEIMKRYAEMTHQAIGDSGERIERAAEHIEIAAESFDLGIGDTKRHLKKKDEK